MGSLTATSPPQIMSIMGRESSILLSKQSHSNWIRKQYLFFAQYLLVLVGEQTCGVTFYPCLISSLTTLCISSILRSVSFIVVVCWSIAVFGVVEAEFRDDDVRVCWFWVVTSCVVSVLFTLFVPLSRFSSSSSMRTFFLNASNVAMDSYVTLVLFFSFSLLNPFGKWKHFSTQYSRNR